MAFRNKKSIFFIIIIIAIPVGFMAINKIAPVGWNLFGSVFATNGVAIDGYDPVAYHIRGKELKGDPEHSIVWNGVIWQFDSADNKTLFQADPKRYAPKFGGYCAIAISKGVTAKVNPKIWHIENSKLFLFFNEDARNDFINKIGDGVIEISEEEWSNAYGL